MSCCISTFTFLFLFGSIGTQLIGFLTSFMVVNRFAPGLHDGLFNRCGAINYFQTAINAAGSFWTSARDGRVKPFSACYWWNSSMFEKDESIICFNLLFQRSQTNDFNGSYLFGLFRIDASYNCFVLRFIGTCGFGANLLFDKLNRTLQNSLVEHFHRGLGNDER
jgi:hypothetical protein